MHCPWQTVRGFSSQDDGMCQHPQDQVYPSQLWQEGFHNYDCQHAAVRLLTQVLTLGNDTDDVSGLLEQWTSLSRPACLSLLHVAYPGNVEPQTWQCGQLCSAVHHHRPVVVDQPPPSEALLGAATVCDVWSLRRSSCRPMIQLLHPVGQPVREAA